MSDRRSIAWCWTAGRLKKPDHRIDHTVDHDHVIDHVSDHWLDHLTYHWSILIEMDTPLDFAGHKT